MIKKQLYLALLLAAAIVLHIVEGLLPTAILIPGAKLGLSNIIILLTLIIYGFKAGFQVLILRVFLSSLLIGTFLTPGFWLSLTGGVVSFVVMGYVHYFHEDKFSVIGVSILGAAFHNFGQVIMAYILIENWRILFYLPYLLLLSLPTGLFVGLIVLKLNRYLKKAVLNSF